MTETLIRLLLRLSEFGEPAYLPGSQARRHFGREFGGLLSAGILEEDVPADTWAVCAGCDCGLDARPIEVIDGSFVALCPLDAASKTVLDEKDLLRFQIHARRLIGCLGSPALSQPTPGLWQLGRRIGGREIFATLARSVVADPAVVSVIAMHAGAPAALVAPRPAGMQAVRLQEAGIPVVPVSEVIDLDADGRPRLDEARAALLIRGGPARIELQVAAKIVLIDGTRQHVPERPFELLRRLVEQACGARGPINNQTFERDTGRDASDVLRELTRALSKDRSNAPEIKAWFVSRRTAGGYELTLDPRSIELLP